MNFFDKVSYEIDKAESSFQTFISSVIPYAVPLIPATVTGVHFAGIMVIIIPNVEPLVYTILGIIAGLVIEFLGMASVYRTSVASVKNKKLEKDEKYATWKPILAFIWYLCVVIIGNGLLELWAGADWKRIIPVMLFSSLSIPTFLMVSDKAIGDARLREKEELRALRKLQQNAHNLQNPAQPALQDDEPALQNSAGKSDWRTIGDKLQKDALTWIKNASIEEIMQKYGLQRRSAYDWKQRASDKLSANGHEYVGQDS